MNNTTFRLFSRFVAGMVLVAGALALKPAHAAEAIGVVTHLSGVVAVQRADGSVKLLAVRSEIEQGDVLLTQAEAYVRIRFIDSAEMVLRPDSVFKIESYVYKEADPKSDLVAFDLHKGGFRAVSGEIGKRSKDAITINAGPSTIRTLGTHLGALFCANDCGGVPTPTGKTPDNGLHVDVASGAVVVTPKLTVALPSSQTPPGASVPMPAQPGSGQTTSGQTPGGSTGTQAPGGTTPNPMAGPVGGVSPTLPGGTGTLGPVPTPTPAPGAGAPAPSVVLNAGQFGYLPPPQNGVQPPLVLVPPNQAVQVRMPQSISQNNPQGSATSKGSDPECVVQ